jgi:transposase, IS5 family
MVDEMTFKSSNRPLSDKRREELAKIPSKQIDTDAKSTIKNAKKYFGYKGHVGVDAESKLICKRTFTAANRHDSQELENVVSGDDKSI